MNGVGLVLGAGGVVGQAYHSGVLAALENDWRWDARSVDVIVGTSAGAITGGLLRAGVPARELAAWTVKAPLSRRGGRQLRRILGTEIPQFEPFRAAQLLRRPSLPGRAMLTQAVTHPWHFRPVAAALTLLAPGRLDILDQLSALREVDGRSWPDRDLWICAVRRRDGRRIVFGRPGSPDVPLHRAIAASCAVPGYFAPVAIDGEPYVDGGAHSPTNAAILRGRPLRLVIVVSPMSGPAPFVPTTLAEAIRWHSARTVRREVAALRASGTEVVVFRPGPEEQEVIGDDFMSRERVDQVVQRAFVAAGRHAATRAEVHELLSGLGRRR
jgi:NTE family protein